MSAPALSRVVVLGRDTDLWLCVNALGRALGPAGVQVVAIELPTRLKPSYVSASLPPLEALHAKLQIKESSLIRATAGSFSFGQNIVAPSGGAAPRVRRTSFMPGEPMGRRSTAVRFFPAGSRRRGRAWTSHCRIFASRPWRRETDAC